MAEENSKDAPATADTDQIKGAIASLKRVDPKILGACGVIAIALILMMAGGGSQQSAQVQVKVAPGQNVVLQNPNIGNTLLVASPGQLSSADYDEKDSQNICEVAGGTPALVEEESVVNYIPWVKVKVLDGPCKDRSGWAPKVNIKN